MKRNIEGWTSAGYWVLHDAQRTPRLAQPRNASDFTRFWDEVANEARRGTIVAYQHEGGGEVNGRLFVDEPVEPALAARARNRAEGLLPVPSGTLLAEGAEALWGGTPDARIEQEIEPGDYEVTGFEVEWGEEAEAAVESVVQEREALAARIERILGPATGGLFVLTLGALVAGCVLAKTPFELPNRALTAVFALAWLVVIGLWRVFRVSRAQDARDRAYVDFPTLVIHLRRLGPHVPGRAGEGCVFGEGFGSSRLMPPE